MLAVTQLVFHDDPARFLAVATDFLAADPVQASVLATDAARAATERAAGIAWQPSTPDQPRPWWLTVHDDHGTVTSVAMRTHPAAPHAAFALDMPEHAAIGLVDALAARGEVLTAVNGALPAVALIAHELARRTGGRAIRAVATRLYEVDVVTPPPSPARGTLRAATAADLDFVIAAHRDFDQAAADQAGRASKFETGAMGDPERAARRIAAGCVWLWTDPDGRPVHLSGAQRPAYGVVRIGPVYTPPEHRGHGYAGASVAELARRFRESGHRVCLFTDQGNPTSNALYRRIGFSPVTDMAEFVVVAGAESAPGDGVTPPGHAADRADAAANS